MKIKLIAGIIVAGISPTKLGGVYAIHGMSLSQFILSGEPIKCVF